MILRAVANKGARGPLGYVSLQGGPGPLYVCDSASYAGHQLRSKGSSCYGSRHKNSSCNIFVVLLP